METAESAEYFLFPFSLLYSFSSIYIEQIILKVRVLGWIILQEMARFMLVYCLRQYICLFNLSFTSYSFSACNMILIDLLFASLS